MVESEEQQEVEPVVSKERSPLEELIETFQEATTWELEEVEPVVSKERSLSLPSDWAIASCFFHNLNPYALSVGLNVILLVCCASCTPDCKVL
ncbi:MAG: hypothetical protein SAK29_24695 [Scytonema sp. PMC 1069.18]|nr:hypothetical protein [Scytonema sp. PMC 1069.18]MEC4887971.1 hypothetical protein [Scytonema sp. PMC 1070.18]